MVSRLHIPCAPLSSFVASFYFYEGFQPEHSVDCFLPNGETEMIIDLTETPKYIYDRESLKEIQACHHVWVSGVRTEPICIPSGRDSRMMIINFKKGGAHAFYPIPLNELTDFVLDADLLFGSGIGELRQMLLEAPTVDHMFLCVENYMNRLIRRKLNREVKDICVEFMINQLVHNPSQITLDELCSRIGYSQKHLIELFKSRVGVTPKSYMRILRFQQVINEIESLGDIDWQQISFTCGYFDQSHFIRDFKSFSGFTPSVYLKQKNDSLNYVPLM